MDFVLKNVWLIALVVFSGGMLLWPMLRRMMSGIGQVSPTEAVLLINREHALVLDVREDAEFAAGHIPEARHIPLSQLAARLPELKKWKEKPIVVSCQSGVRSSNACAVLRRSGFAQAVNLAGGIAAWQAAKLPLGKE